MDFEEQIIEGIREMRTPIEILNIYRYKKDFLPDILEHNLINNNAIQVFRIESYLRNILMPVIPYRTTFNFIIFVTRGTFIQYLEDKSYEFYENECINIKQGSTTATLSFSEDIEGFFVAFENEIVTHMALGLKNIKFFQLSPIISINPNTANWITNMFILLEEELESKGRVWEICITMLEIVLLKLAKNSQKGLKQSLHRSLEIAFQFRELVQKFHVDHKDLGYYADLLHISENYLSKCVKETTNKPPKQWINEISILHSKILLKDMTRDIGGIAYELQFESPSYFTRIFKKTTGYSPSEYRMKFINGN
ncbi:MAG: helix-turn-helix domain-containing protein [Sphingobacterium sp.]